MPRQASSPISLAAVLLAAAILVSRVAAIGDGAASPANWPRWRGPADNGSIEGGDYPLHWSPTNGIVWRVALPGKGCSTPIVWDSRIYLTAGSEGRNGVLAFDDQGRRLWLGTLGAEIAGKNKNGSGANPSPCTDGVSLFVYFKSGDLAALDPASGRVLWTTNLSAGFGADTLYWDFGSTPVLTQQDVVVALLRRGESWLAAFDKRTGVTHWRVPRQYTTLLEGDHSYASPVTLHRQGRESVLVWGATHLTAHDPADGRVLWDCGDFNPDGREYWPAVASPVPVGDLAVIAYGRGEVLHAIRLDGTGEVTATHRVWRQKDLGAFVPTPAESAGRVYVLRDGGEVVCVGAGDGAVVWRGALPKHANKFYASPLVAGGTVYAAREDGVVFVTSTAGPFSLLAENRLEDRLIASPVPFGGRLLLRGEKMLYLIGR